MQRGTSLKIGQKAMHGTIKNFLLLAVSFVYLATMVINGCDTWYYLREPESKETEITQIFQYGTIKIGGNTAIDYSDLALGIIIHADTDMVVYADSLHVKHDQKSLNLNVPYEGKKRDERVFHLEKGTSNHIVYHQTFYPPFQYGGRLTIYAKNYIRVGEETFSIDTVQFEFTKLTEPSP